MPLVSTGHFFPDFMAIAYNITDIGIKKIKSTKMLARFSLKKKKHKGKLKLKNITFCNLPLLIAHCLVKEKKENMRMAFTEVFKNDVLLEEGTPEHMALLQITKLIKEINNIHFWQ